MFNAWVFIFNGNFIKGRYPLGPGIIQNGFLQGPKRLEVY